MTAHSIPTTTAGRRLLRKGTRGRSAVAEGAVDESDSRPLEEAVPTGVWPRSSERATTGSRDPRKLLPNDGSGSLESFRQRSVQSLTCVIWGWVLANNIAGGGASPLPGFLPVTECSEGLSGRQSRPLVRDHVAMTSLTNINDVLDGHVVLDPLVHRSAVSERLHPIMAVGGRPSTAGTHASKARTSWKRFVAPLPPISETPQGRTTKFPS